MLRTLSVVSGSKNLLIDRSAGVFSRWERRIITTTAVASPKHVVVFDIDRTIALEKAGTIASNSKNKFSDEHVLDDGRYHVIPHIKSVLNYLLSKNVRIAVFSAGTEDRNLELLQKICARTFGQNHKSLLSDGQFEVFSRHHLQEYKYCEDFSDDKKDLTVIMKPDEKLENCVLIDDNSGYGKPGQEANFILVPKIIGFDNYGFYFLGLFKSYFESDSCNVKPISQFMSEHIECDQSTEPSIQFILDMIKIGLNEVRKTEPTAEFYNYKEFVGDVIQNSKWCGLRTIDRSTNLPIVVDENSVVEEIEDALMRWFHTEHL